MDLKYFPLVSTHVLHFSVIRTQLQVLRWFLEAMRSDNSTLMVPITSAWAYKLVKSYKAIFFYFCPEFFSVWLECYQL